MKEHTEAKKEVFKCRECKTNWSKGYCSTCGKLVCDECSKHVGYARVCLKCFTSVLEGEKDITKLKNYLRKHDTSSIQEFKLVHRVEKKSIREAQVVYLRIGFDDVDSPYGYCTTYLGALLSEKLEDRVTFLDYPHLIRFNPNIPMKTRGNAGIAFQIKVNKNKVEEIKDLVINTIQSSTQSAFPTTESAVAFFSSVKEKNPRKLVKIYHKAVKDILRYEEVTEITKGISRGTLEVFSHKAEPQGIVGALASIGAVLSDYTFELLAYRCPSLQKSQRNVAKEKLKNFDKMFEDVTFANLDGDKVLITPHGPDPVLFGLRGDFPLPLIKGLNLLEHEAIERWTLYKTNQATNAHIVEVKHLTDGKVYQTIKIPLWVKADPKIEEGNVILPLSDGENQCKAILYPPTGHLRKIGRQFGIGDKIEVTGVVVGKQGKKIELNVEALRPLRILPKRKQRNPFCPKCGHRIKSKGQEEYKCPSCGYRLRKKTKLLLFGSEKEIQEKKRYLPPPKAYRHLTRPKERRKFSILKERGELQTLFVKPFTGREKVPVSKLKPIKFN